MKLLLGDCLEQLKLMPDNSVDSIVTDPPYGLSAAKNSGKRSKGGFMGKLWDHSVPSVDVWRECLRVLKPGGHALIACGTRTQHRMVVNVEDAGFEVRDVIAYHYGSGFPKSADVSKKIDSQERNKWINISKAIDKDLTSGIMSKWIELSNRVNFAEVSFAKSEIEIGTSTPKSDSVLVSVAPQSSLENSTSDAIIADLSLSDHHPTSSQVVSSIVRANAEATTTPSKAHAKSAVSSPESQSLKQSMSTFIAQCDARALLSENPDLTIKAVEALTTWLGKKQSSKKADLDALFADLNAVLKLITLSQSKTFQSLDTKSQMDFASAITVTITRSTAESLISFTADTLRSKAIDKAAGAEREVIEKKSAGSGPLKRGHVASTGGGMSIAGTERSPEYSVTAPATPEARKWQGFGTALKPATEFWTLVRKPLEGTVAANVLKWGVGGLNIDASRVATDETLAGGGGKLWSHYRDETQDRAVPRINEGQGRFPANVIFDEAAAEVLDEQAPKVGGGGPGNRKISRKKGNSFDVGMKKPELANQFSGPKGGASRFFYCAKASKKERNAGMPTGETNGHPTIKPLKLMEYLIRLITPPGGTCLDPFMGSGTTGVAARRLGFGFIGIEMSPEYVEIAKRRIEAGG